jgi:DnaJ homolog subfamily B member 12
MDGNRDDAERCLARAEDALSERDFARARRFLGKSTRMFPLKAAQTRLEEQIATAEAMTAPSGNSSRRSSSASDTGQSSRANSSSSVDKVDVDVRTASSEMLTVVENVRRGKKEGHYGTLGIARNADEADIKKAFRKLALALHPDKNCAPGAEEAFKLVSRASEVLSDPERRRVYDQFGVDDMSELRSSGSGYGMSSQGQASRQARRRRKGPIPGRNRPPGYPRNLEEELDDLMASMTPEQVFDFLFTASREANADVRANQPPAQSLWTRYRPLTLLATVAFCLMLVSGGSNEPSFSLSPTPALTVRRSTAGVGVPYYVSRFHKVSPDRPLEQVRLENAVNQAAMDAFTTLCVLEHQRRDELFQMSRAWLSRASTRQEYAQKARDFNMANCRERESLQERIRSYRQHGKV